MPAKIVSMKRTAAEKAAERKGLMGEPEGQDFPYGLALHLGKDEIDKLGLDLPEVGAEVVIAGKAVATSVGTSASERGGETRNVTLQVTELGVEAAPKGRDTAAALRSLYTSMAKDDAEG